MAAQLKDMARASSVQFVRAAELRLVIDACENPPRASAELKEFVARARKMRNA